MMSIQRTDDPSSRTPKHPHNAPKKIPYYYKKIKYYFEYFHVNYDKVTRIYFFEYYNCDIFFHFVVLFLFHLIFHYFLNFLKILIWIICLKCLLNLEGTEYKPVHNLKILYDAISPISHTKINRWWERASGPHLAKYRNFVAGQDKSLSAPRTLKACINDSADVFDDFR